MQGIVQASRLNVRARPDRDGKIVGSLLNGTIIDVLGQKGGWFEISYTGLSAFVNDDFIELISKPKAMKGVVTANLLNVRAQPSLNGRIVGSVIGGAVVNILARHGEWLEIEFNSGIAFVHRDFVDMHTADELKRGVVSVGLLNVRSQPGLAGSIVGQLAQNETVNIVARVGEWYEIKFNGSSAFVHSAFVDTDSFAISDEPDAPVEVSAREEDEDDSRIPHAPDIIDSHDSPDTAPLEPVHKMPVAGNSHAQNVARTWNKFGNLLDVMSHDIGIDTGAAVAVLCVESSGKGFEADNQNRMIIRFENHKFWSYWGRQNPEKFHAHFQYKKGEAWKEHKWRKSLSDEWRTFHGNQAAEWHVLECARSIDDSAALQSISMGAPQIMGFHYQRIGYDTVQDMFEKFNAEIRFHILGLFDFFDNSMIQALKKLEFVTFAGKYNGSGQMEKYGQWIRNHYDAYKKLIV